MITLEELPTKNSKNFELANGYRAYVTFIDDEDGFCVRILKGIGKNVEEENYDFITADEVLEILNKKL